MGPADFVTINRDIHNPGFWFLVDTMNEPTMKEFLGDPVSRLTAMLAITLVGMFSLLVVALNEASGASDTAYKAQIVANEAMNVAKSARPNRYTAIDNDKDEQDHLAFHRHESDVLDRITKSNLELLESRITRMIQTLPIPPESVKAALTECQKKDHEANLRINAVETQLEHLKDSMKRQ